MIVNVEGVVSDSDAGELIRACEFFADQLMDPRMVRNLEIEIEVKKRLDVEGECVDEDGFRNPRWFTINLRKKKMREMIKTLGHEMVHVKQHAKNELRPANFVPAKGGLRVVTEWNGEIWYPGRKQDHYYDSPKQKTAYDMEVGLFAKWMAKQ